MAEHYVDTLTIHRRGFDGHPLPENLTDARSLTVDVGAPLDLDQLADEVRTDLGGRPRAIRQTYRETAWGAAGAGVILVVDVPTVFAGLGGIAVLWDVISKRVLSRRRPQADGRAEQRMLTADVAVRSARAWAAECLNIGADGIRIVNMETVGDGYHAEIETPLGPFIVELDSGGATQIRRC